MRSTISSGIDTVAFTDKAIECITQSLYKLIIGLLNYTKSNTENEGYQHSRWKYNGETVLL
jgi:hypothetical protein